MEETSKNDIDVIEIEYGSSPLDESSDDYDNDNNGIQVTKRPRSVADSTLHDFYDKINLPLGKKEIDQLLNQLNGEHQPSSFDVSSANLLDIEVASINLKIEKLHALTEIITEKIENVMIKIGPQRIVALLSDSGAS
ncbi:898_t:CDS:2, partial [Entrophospora sp. SA101]